MIDSVTNSNLAVAPVSSYMYSPFHQTGYRQPSGMWMRANPSPYEQFVRKAAENVASFLESSRKLQRSAQELGREAGSLFRSRETQSSDPSAIAVEAKDGAAVGAYRIQVYSLASAQVHVGKEMAGDAPSEQDSGVHRLKLSIAGRETTVDIRMAAGDSNEQALGRIRDAINDARAGVTASLASGGNGTVRLELRSDRTGTDHRFTVTDEAGSAAAWSGITEATAAASDAAYSVNGGAAISAQSNVVELEKGKATAFLLAVTDAPVAVEVRALEEKALARIGRLVADYNDTITRLTEAGGYMSPHVRKSLEGTVSEATFGAIGIRVNGDGTLSVDERALRTRLRTDSERAARAAEGAARSLEQEASRFQAVPASGLLNPHMMALQQFAAYQATMQAYLQIPTTGLLIHSLI
ncbi:flagellar cap protein FliD N-terminal domain-containing protein [Cohnella hongkongensis]|uniref:Filament cap protein n=1 Tax=Cohnella hongkongensis TaxID=178337 RepID=A0ABV9F6K9_9BACL